MLVLGDSFASNSDNTVAPFDWPILIEQQQSFGLDLEAMPGWRLGFHIWQNKASYIPGSTADVLLIAAGVNDALEDFGIGFTGNTLYRPEFERYYENGDTFTSILSWNVYRVLVEEIVADWRVSHPGKPIVLFTIPPVDQYLDDGGGVTSFRRNRKNLANEWIKSYANTEPDVYLYDINQFLLRQGDYYNETFPPDQRLHPDPATQQLLANDIYNFLT